MADRSARVNFLALAFPPAFPCFWKKARTAAVNAIPESLAQTFLTRQAFFYLTAKHRLNYAARMKFTPIVCRLVIAAAFVWGVGSLLGWRF